MDENDTLEETCNKWYKTVDGILHQCFKKIKISSIPPKRTLDFQIYKSLEEIKLNKELLLTADDMMKPLLKIELDKREQQAATLQEVEWRGRKLPVKQEKIRIFLLREQEFTETEVQGKSYPVRNSI